VFALRLCGFVRTADVRELCYASAMSDARHTFPVTTAALGITLFAALSMSTPGCSSSPESPAPGAEPATRAESASPLLHASGPPVVEPGAPHPFLASPTCAQCHSQTPSARALTSANGDDASPFGTWQATAMANSFRDPYWRAQMAREVELAPERKSAIETLCITCHAPIAHHDAVLHGSPVPDFAGALAHPLAADGVSCTICHRAQPEGLGTPATFNGKLPIRGEPVLFGPFAEPSTAPMFTHTGYTPTHGAHVSKAALCGSCHTLYTSPPGRATPFLEQAPYLEWRNSVYSDENGATAESRTCQECHMPDAGSMRIARSPSGLDFAIQVRDEVRTHTFVGGNALLIDLLRENAAELGVTASEGALRRNASAARALLSHSTARVTIERLSRTEGVLEFDVRVENLTGHKLPSGYPARRAWLDVEVRAGRTSLFESGDYDDAGRLKNIADEFDIAHADVIESASQVAVYEMVALDGAGKPTTNLTTMTELKKDTRLLPRGWKKDGPHADETKPRGVDGDDDFTAGSDVVTYRTRVPADAGELTVAARFFYQSIPPAWSGALDASRTEEAQTFLRMLRAQKRTPETIAVDVKIVP
jgi:hypothetical protein